LAKKQVPFFYRSSTMEQPIINHLKLTGQVNGRLLRKGSLGEDGP